LPDTSGLAFSLKGPTQLKVGEPVKLDLVMASTNALRAVPMQLAFDPTQFAVIRVSEGDYFGHAGKNQFSSTIDERSGRVSIGAASTDPEGVKGELRLLSIELRPLTAAPEARLSIIGLTPIGSTRAIDRPNLPISFPMVITP
jgi:general secretion pathway protein D